MAQAKGADDSIRDTVGIPEAQCVEPLVRIGDRGGGYLDSGSGGCCGQGGCADASHPFHSPIGNAGRQAASIISSLNFLPEKSEMGFRLVSWILFLPLQSNG